MDNDDVFIAEAEAHSGLAARSRTSAQEGRNRLFTGRGRGRKSPYSDSEETPLLEEEGEAAGNKLLMGTSDEGQDRGTVWAGQADFEGLPWWKRPSIYWILPPFLLTTLAFGGIIVPKLNLILQLVCREYIHEQQLADPSHSLLPVIFGAGAENPQCRIPEVQSRVATFTLIANLIAGILSAIVSPKLGALSDRYGRVRLIVLCSLGSLTGEVITILAATYPDTFNVNWILLGYAMEGLFGSFTASMALANAYASDCTPPARRNVAFGYFHGCLFTGIAMGPLISGLIVKRTGSVLTIFYIALGCHLFFITILLLFIPESLSRARQIASRERHRKESEEASSAPGYSRMNSWLHNLNPWTLLKPLKILYPTGEGSSPAVRRNLVLLAIVDTTMFGVAMGSMTVVIYYSEYAFGWGTYESSIFVSVVNCCRVFCLLVILPLATRIFRGPASKAKTQKNTGCDGLDLGLIRIAVLFDTIGYLGYTLSKSGPLFILSGAVASIGGIGSPTLQSALTKHVPRDRTGQLLGASGLLHALSRVVAPTIFNAIYAATVKSFSRTVFVCLTATWFVVGVVSWFVRSHVYIDESDTPVMSQTSGEEEELRHS